MSQPKVKRRVGKYEVGRTIGEGTFAKVKFARNSETGEPVALKILDKEKVLKHKMAEQVPNLIHFLIAFLFMYVCMYVYYTPFVISLFFSIMLQIRREIATMKLIKHPNVVRLYEVLSLSFFLFFFLSCFGNCMNLLTVSNFRDRKLVCDPMLCERKEYHVAVLLGCIILYKSLKTALEFGDKFLSVR